MEIENNTPFRVEVLSCELCGLDFLVTFGAASEKLQKEVEKHPQCPQCTDGKDLVVREEKDER